MHKRTNRVTTITVRALDRKDALQEAHKASPWVDWETADLVVPEALAHIELGVAG